MKKILAILTLGLLAQFAHAIPSSNATPVYNGYLKTDLDFNGKRGTNINALAFGTNNIYAWTNTGSSLDLMVLGSMKLRVNTNGNLFFAGTVTNSNLVVTGATTLGNQTFSSAPNIITQGASGVILTGIFSGPIFGTISGSSVTSAVAQAVHSTNSDDAIRAVNVAAGVTLTNPIVKGSLNLTNGSQLLLASRQYTALANGNNEIQVGTNPVIRISGNTGTVNIVGLIAEAGNVEGDTKIIEYSGSYPAIVAYESGLATAKANRIVNPTLGDYFSPGPFALTVHYHGGRWHVVAFTPNLIASTATNAIARVNGVASLSLSVTNYTSLITEFDVSNLTGQTKARGHYVVQITDPITYTNGQGDSLVIDPGDASGNLYDVDVGDLAYYATSLFDVWTEQNGASTPVPTISNIITNRFPVIVTITNGGVTLISNGAVLYRLDSNGKTTGFSADVADIRSLKAPVEIDSDDAATGNPSFTLKSSSANTLTTSWDLWNTASASRWNIGSWGTDAGRPAGCFYIYHYGDNYEPLRADPNNGWMGVGHMSGMMPTYEFQVSDDLLHSDGSGNISWKGIAAGNILNTTNYSGTNINGALSQATIAASGLVTNIPAASTNKLLLNTNDFVMSTKRTNGNYRASASVKVYTTGTLTVAGDVRLVCQQGGGTNSEAGFTSPLGLLASLMLTNTLVIPDMNPNAVYWVTNVNGTTSGIVPNTSSVAGK